MAGRRAAIVERFPRPSVMGVVNVTPDSFSDEGAFLHPAGAIAEARGMVEEGAAIIDIGGSVLVNSAFIAPPYQISSIGPEDLYERVSASQGFIAFVVARADAFGVRISFLESDAVDVPAYAGTIGFRYGRVVSAESTVPSAAPSAAP